MARFRPDPALVAIMNLVREDEVDRAMYATVEAGVVDPAWFAVRRISVDSIDPADEEVIRALHLYDLIVG